MFSPDGRLFATATDDHDSVRVYDSRNGSLLVKFPIKVYTESNHSLAWASVSNQLFALSHLCYIHRVDVSTGTMLSKWRIHNSDDVLCTALEISGTLIAACAGSFVSFWDITTQEQIGPVIEYTHRIWALAVSSNYDLVASGDNRITVRALCGILPSYYLDNVSLPA